MSVITLTTDWGLRDHYVAALKGELISLCPDVRIVDISHDIAHFDILQASYMLSNCYEKFPEGTIHFVAMHGNKLTEESQGYLLIKCKGHYFTGYDSGIFFLTLGDLAKEIYKLNISPSLPLYLANTRLCSVVSAIVNGSSPEALGVKTDELVRIFNTQPTSDSSAIRGSVIHVDHFHNIISNITRELFEQTGHQRPFTVSIRNQHFHFKQLHQNYDDADESELVVMFNEKGNLVIALNRSTAATLLGMKLFDTVRIEFDDNENR